MTAPIPRSHVRLLAIIEASTVTGPTKNLLEFCRIARTLESGPIVETSLVTFGRMGMGTSGKPSPNEFTKEALREGIPIHSIPERFAFDPQVIGKLKKAVDDQAPDIIQTHGLKSSFLLRVCGAHRGRRWVAFHHGYTSTTYRRELLTHLDRWSLRAPSRVVTVSQAFAQQLSALGVPSDRLTVLHNAIDPNWLWSQKEDSPPAENRDSAPIVSKGEKLVLAVGRLSREKAFPDLVAAMRCLKQMRPELGVRLAIVGEGRERKCIEDAIQRAGLERQIRLVGHLEDVRPYYRVADVVAISSLSEGSPNVLLEAMAAGVPVVATRVGGIPEIVSDGETALLVPPRDPAALAFAINRLLCDRTLRENIAGRAREAIKSRHSPMSRALSLVSLYERLCSLDQPAPRTNSWLAHRESRARASGEKRRPADPVG